MSFIEPAPAKINLALHLRRRRQDGYHDLETVFAFTEFGDTLAVSPADDLSLTVVGEFAGPSGRGPDNLVLLAARALAAAAGVAPLAALMLDKRIPVAAGLGGGSADAAAALRLLNRFWGLDWDNDRLRAIADSLGSDVPACVDPITRFGTGRGEQLSAWPATLTGTPVMLVNPRVSVPTGLVFERWDGIDRGEIMAGASLPSLRNDMTVAAVALAPVIAEVLAALVVTDGVELVRMSGSGATCLALYRAVENCQRAADSLAARGWWTQVSRLL